MNKFNIKTGVIGTGSMGKNHVRILNEISDLVAISDLNSSEGGNIASSYGVDFYDDFIRMLPKLDAVSIATPTSTHSEIVSICANAGVHVLVEKPIAGNLLEAESMIEVCKKNNVTLAVGHIERFNPVIDIAKKKILNGDWGQIITLSSRRVSNFPQRISDVGVLFDLAIHDIDISSYLADKAITSVFSSGGNIKASNEDFVILILEHEDGIISHCETNWLTPMKKRQLFITTTTHFVEIDYVDQKIDMFQSSYENLNDNNLFKNKLLIENKQIRPTKEEPLKLELVDFLLSVQNGNPPKVTGLDGLNAIRVSIKALESLKSGMKEVM